MRFKPLQYAPYDVNYYSGTMHAGNSLFFSKQGWRVYLKTRGGYWFRANAF